MILGITGTDGAGKGTVVEYLANKHSFVHFSARAVIEEEIARQGLPNTREQMRKTGNALRAAHGDDVLVARPLEQIAAQNIEHAVIESVRALAEVETLKAHGGILLAVDADQQLRYERIMERKSSSDQVSFAEFQKQEALEMNDSDPHGMQKAKVMAAADHTLSNDNNLDVLYEQIENFLREYKAKG